MSYQASLSCMLRPAPPLDAFVERLWYWEGMPVAHAKDRMLPSGTCSLIINLAEDETRSYSGPNDEVVERYPARCGCTPTELLARRIGDSDHLALP